jgi:hypothetical protein
VAFQKGLDEVAFLFDAGLEEVRKIGRREEIFLKYGVSE